MATYIQLNQADLEEITAEYGLTIAFFKPVANGSNNSNYYLATTSGEFILTVFEEKSPEKTQEVIQLLLWLKKHDFSTNIPYLTKNGTYITSFQKKTVLIKKWIDGIVTNELSKDNLLKIGQAIGQLHEVPIPKFIGSTISYETSALSSVVGKNIDPTYEKWLARHLTIFSKMDFMNLPRSIIHGDMFWDNVIFENGNIARIIDFEDACCYYSAYDLGMAIIGLCINDQQLNWSKMEALLTGYQQIRVLQKKERILLQYFTELAAVLTSNWRIWKYHVATPTPKRAKLHREMMDIANHIGMISKERFLRSI